MWSGLVLLERDYSWVIEHLVCMPQLQSRYLIFKRKFGNKELESFAWGQDPVWVKSLVQKVSGKRGWLFNTCTRRYAGVPCMSINQLFRMGSSTWVKPTLVQAGVPVTAEGLHSRLLPNRILTWVSGRPLWVELKNKRPNDPRVWYSTRQLPNVREVQMHPI